MRSLVLGDIASRIGGVLTTSADESIECRSISASSSAVSQGALFVAVRGFAADGHTFIADALKSGAVAAVVEDRASLGSLPGIVVPNTRIALSRLASLFHGEPSKILHTVGITGTNGKTTTNWIIYHVLNTIGGGCQRIGTLGSECMGRDTQSGSLTSPDPMSLHRMMESAVSMGAQSCVVEASSHALDQARVEDLQFDVGVFTNLTRDHLDYHKTFENYFAAKRHLFDLVAGSAKATKGAVINRDDEYGRRLIAELPALGLRDWSFGAHAESTVRITGVEETAQGMVIRLHDKVAGAAITINAPFIGRHNAENVVAAYGACRALGYSPDVIREALAEVAQVPGRLERVGEGGPRVFVDYAHTPDALMRAIQAVRHTTKGALWVVFGCGGDRDKGKRPEMGSIASTHADRVVVTSDNPRSEDPEAILKDILVGTTNAHIVEIDRKRAIQRAIAEAGALDTVLIAGKGHEDYQIIGKETFYFSDQAVARECLEGMVAKTSRI